MTAAVECASNAPAFVGGSKMRNSLKALLAASSLLVASAAAAQPARPPVEIRVERIAPGVAVLFGQGGNIGLSYGVDGNILIDDQFAPLTERILGAVRTVDPDPVRFVINTHWHGDHTGGNENLGSAGAVIVAHDNVRRRMSAGQMLRGEAVAPAPGAALPVVTFAQGLNIHLNGDEVQAIHVQHAHTDGDTLIRWRRANVLHMGDTYFNGMLPFIDLESGGSIDGLIVAVERALEIADSETVIIPGHGPLAREADLARYRDMLVNLRARVGQGIAAGRTLDQIQAERHADAFGRPTDFISPEAFIRAVYESLRSGDRAH